MKVLVHTSCDLQRDRDLAGMHAGMLIPIMCALPLLAISNERFVRLARVAFSRAMSWARRSRLIAGRSSCDMTECTARVASCFADDEWGGECTSLARSTTLTASSHQILIEVIWVPIWAYFHVMTEGKLRKRTKNQEHSKGVVRRALV